MTDVDEGRAYRWALGGFATGVVLITADGPMGPAGIIVNSFTSVSLEPRLVLWCLGDASDRFALFAGAEFWGANILAATQHDISARFARPGALDAGDLAIDRLGDAPMLKGALTHLACRTRDRRAVGDHLLIVGEVTAFASAEAGDGLTYFRGRYGHAAVES